MVICNCCNAKLKKFGRMARRDNALCPRCGALERTRQAALVIKQTNLHKTDKVLHVAPCQSLVRFVRSKCGEYISINIDDGAERNKNVPSHKQTPKPNIINTCEDLYMFEDESIDYYISINVLEHVKHDYRAIAEAFRVLKRLGTAVINVPISFNLIETKEAPSTGRQFHHQRAYGADFPDKLATAGFDVETVNIYNNYPKSKLLRHGLYIERNGIEGELPPVFICKKLS